MSRRTRSCQRREHTRRDPSCLTASRSTKPRKHTLVLWSRARTYAHRLNHVKRVLNLVKVNTVKRNQTPQTNSQVLVLAFGPEDPLDEQIGRHLDRVVLGQCERLREKMIAKKIHMSVLRGFTDFSVSLCKCTMSCLGDPNEEE